MHLGVRMDYFSGDESASYCTCQNLYLHEGIVDASAVWQEETAPRGQLVEEEQFLLGPLCAVVPLLGFFHAMLVVCHELLVWEGDAINPLHTETLVAMARLCMLRLSCMKQKHTCRIH